MARRDDDTLPSLLRAALAACPDTQRCIVAYSGGRDSHALLHLACRALDQLGEPPPLALHVNHGISPHADRWQRHCAQICDALGVALHCASAPLPLPAPNLEARARSLRYRAFRGYLRVGDLLLLAHHIDDQVETALLRLLRGAGAAGLGGMPARRPLGLGVLMRPLLSAQRAELARYAERHGLVWVEDESNQSLAPDRNYLRHRVLPALAARWPGYRATVARGSGLMRESAQLNRCLAEQDGAQAQQRDGLAVAALQALSAPRRANLLRHWLARHGAPTPSAAQLAAMDRTMLSAPADATPCVQWGGAVLRRHRGALFWMPQLAESPSGPLAWQLARPLRVAGAGELCARPVVGAGLRRGLGECLEVRFRVGGERCQPAMSAGQPRRRPRSLKKLLHERGVPVWLRGRLPLLFLDGRLAAVADLWRCEGFAAGANEPGWQIDWRPPLPFPGHR